MKAETVQFDLELTTRELLEWLYDRGAAKTAVDVREFGAEQGLDEDDLQLLIDDMEQSSHIVGPRGFGSRAVTLTASGVREVQRLRRSPRTAASSPAAAQPGPGQPGSVIYNFVNNSGPMSVNGTNYSQTVNHGLDAEAILRGAAQLRQLLSDAQGLPGEDRVVLQHQMSDVEAEAAKQDASPGKIKTLLAGIQQRLLEAAAKVAATEAADTIRDQLLPVVHELMKARGLN